MAEKTLKNGFCGWLRATTGSIAMYMALMLPVLTGAVGMAIDMSESYLMYERLTRALDAAALAVAGSSSLETKEQMQARVDQFMAANYPPNKIGAPYNIKVMTEGDFVTVSASASYNTTFLRFLGINTINTDAKTKVEKKYKGIEVALLLDNTGSMSFKPSGSTKTNIQALKDSSTDFVNIMFSKAKKAEDVRIGLVPYANTVRLGLYGLGEVPDPLTGNSTGTYNGGVKFVTLPAGKTKNNFYVGRSGTATNGTFNNSNSDHDNSTKWYGCVIEHKNGGYNANSATNDPYPNDVEDDYEGSWETFRYSTWPCTQFHCSDNQYRNDGTCVHSNKFVCDQHTVTIANDPNEGCPYANIMPMNSTQSKILNGIKTMQANGNTQGNTGMIWGYRLISPEAPFSEGAAWDSKDWKKAIIMMTDGDNTWDATGYSEYWLSERNTGISESTLDSRFAKVCETLKDDREVLIYTVVFKSQTAPTDATKLLYKNCASNPDTNYFYAPTQDKLKEVFAQIAHELSNLHIAE